MRFSTRVSLKEQKKWGGACIQALTWDERHGGTGREIIDKKRKERLEVDAKDPFLKDEASLRAMREALQSELKNIKDDIGSKVQDKIRAKASLDKHMDGVYDEVNRHAPTALMSGLYRGDLSVQEIERTKAKPVTKSLVSSDAMAAIMRGEMGPETEAPKRKVLQNKTTTKSVEASYGDWMNELGKY